MKGTNELETRLTDTLRAVADQTEATPPERIGLAPVEAFDRHRSPERSRPTGLWLALAAATIAVVGAAGFLVARQTIGTEATDPADRGTPTPAPPPIGDDGVLYLLPPDPELLTGAAEVQAGDEVVGQAVDAHMLIGSTAGENLVDLVLVFHAPTPDSFAIDEQTTEEVAGRELFDSFDEGVAERLDDGSWIVYQAEFGEPRLEAAVAGTSLVDGELVFDGTGTDLEVIARIPAGVERARSVISYQPAPRQRPAELGPLEGFLLITASADDPGEALVYAGDLTPSLSPITVAGRPAHQYTALAPGSDSVTITAWSPIDGHVAVLMAWGLSAGEASDYAASLEGVEGETWRAALEG